MEKLGNNLKKYQKKQLFIISFFISWLAFCGAIIYFYSWIEWEKASETDIPALTRFFLVLNTFIFCTLSCIGIRQVWTIVIFYFNRKRILNNSGKLNKIKQNKKIFFLYCTCDDFDERSIEKIKDQNYKNYKTFILDDSIKTNYINQINSYGIKNNIEVIRRQGRKGFKAGNINNFLKINKEHYDYLVILDADEILDKNFCIKSLPYFETYKDIGMVQAAHHSKRSNNKFVDLSKYGIFSNSLVLSSVAGRYGVVSSAGHGIIISREILEKTNGIPEVLSEDLALTIESLEHGYKIAFASEIICDEEFPVDYTAFKKRQGRWIRGDFELIKKYFFRILKTKVSFSEKIDMVIRVFQTPISCLIPPLSLFCLCYFSIIDFNFFTIIYLTVPLTLFAVSLVFNEILFWARKIQPHRLLMFLFINWLIYASSVFNSFKAIFQSIFGVKKKFIITRKQQQRFTFFECIKLNFGEILTGLIILASASLVFVYFENTIVFSSGFILYFPLLSTPFLTYLSNFKVKNKSK